MTKNITEKYESIKKKINSAEKILIIPDGKRVDHDCISSSLALKFFLKRLGKESRIYLFSSVPKYMQTFVAQYEIEQKKTDEVDFNFYDLIFLIDTSQFDRLLGPDYENILNSTDLNKFINIDHHEPGNIYNSIPENVIATVGEASTTKVLFDYLIEPSGIELDKDIAEMLYIGLVSDSQFFRFGVRHDTLTFGQTLLNTGIDHYKTLDMLTTIQKGSIDYFVLAMRHTKFYSELKLTTLIVSDDLNEQATELLGKDWQSQDYWNYYNDIFAAKVEGYDYSVTMRSINSGKDTRMNWRSRNYGTIALLDIFRKMDFDGGGHRNSGGGTIKNMTPSEAENRFRELLKEALPESA